SGIHPGGCPKGGASGGGQPPATERGSWARLRGRGEDGLKSGLASAGTDDKEDSRATGPWSRVVMHPGSGSGGSPGLTAVVVWLEAPADPFMSLGFLIAACLSRVVPFDCERRHGIGSSAGSG